MTDHLNLEQVTTLSGVAALIAQGLRDYQIDPLPLFEEAGIDIRDATLPDKRVQTTRLQALWRLAVDASGDECFGLKLAAHSQPSMLQGLGFAWLASDTLRDGLNRLVRFSRFVNAVIDVRLVDIDQSVDLVITGPEKWPNFVFAAADMGMAAFLGMCRITAGQSLDPEVVYLQRPRPGCHASFDAVFKAPIYYGAKTNRLRFRADQLDKPLPTPSPELARINDQAVIDYLARYDRDSTAMQVRSRIIELLPDGTPQQNNIASTLNLSLRSLQRRLKEEGTNFKGLLEDTRRELALHYIRETHRPIGEITYLLGFSEPSNFTRAFRRWTGMAPAEYRENGQTDNSLNS
jgi:AraC-like DNA-binding protein